MHCQECQKETICQYGLVLPPDTNYFGQPDENSNCTPVFCSTVCLHAFLRARGYLSTSERRIAELEAQVDELQEQLNAQA